MDFRSRIFWISTSLVAGVVSLGSAQITRVSNPQTPQQRGQAMDGILRTLVDSKNNLSLNQPLAPVPAANVTPQMQQAARSLQSFANEAAQLITALRFEERYSSYIRGVLGDALRVKATADVLVTRAAGLRDVSQLSAEYAELDRQWRLLSHQLQQVANLSNTVVRRVEQLNTINDELGRQLKITPQLEQQELIYFFAAMAEDFLNLADDVRLDLQGHPDRDRYARDLQQLEARSQQLRLAVEARYSYRDVASYYKEFFNAWLSTKGDMRSVDNRYLQRSITRITQINDRIHELLWLPPVIDGRDILYQAEGLVSQLDTVGDGVTLTRLVRVENADAVLAKCREFYTLCDDFRQSVATETQLDNLRWDFRVLDVSWNDVKRILDQVVTSDTQHRVAAIDASVAQLRNSLGLQAVIDYAEAVQLASALDNASGLLYFDVGRFVGRQNQLPSALRDALQTRARQFHESTRTLHLALRENLAEDRIAPQARSLAQQWDSLQQALMQLTPEQRTSLARAGQDVAPALAKLQVMFNY